MPPAGEEKASGRGPVSFGIERLGLFPARAPRFALVVALALAALAFLGAGRIGVDDSLSQLFRSDDPAFRQFEQVSKEFPSSEFDVVIVISGDKLLARDNVEKLQTLATDLQLVDGANGLISMFSARSPAPEGGNPAAAVPG